MGIQVMATMLGLKTLTKSERLKKEPRLVCKSMTAINCGAPPGPNLKWRSESIAAAEELNTVVSQTRANS